MISQRRAPSLTLAGLQVAVQQLTAMDDGLARIVAAHGAPPLWPREAGLATLVHMILEQQVSLQSAATLFRKLQFAVPQFSPAALSAMGVDGLRALGLTRQKASYVVALADRVASGALPLATLARYSDANAAGLLMHVPGIGPWTASVYQLMVLRRPDVWPPGDLALHKAIQRLRGLEALPSTSDATCIADAWSPWRAVAARILWHGYLAERAMRAPSLASVKEFDYYSTS